MKTSMMRSKLVMVATLLTASMAGYGHVKVQGPVEAGGGGYIGAASGNVIKIGDGGCLQAGGHNDDNQIDACEGIETAAVEPVAEPIAVIEPTPEPTLVPISRSIKAQFPSGSAVLSSEAEGEIASLISELSQMTEIVFIEVAGYSDSYGRAENNQKLSKLRADAVTKRLEAAFPNAQITSIGHGESNPIAPNDTAAGRAANRRVDVNVTAKAIQS